jgi:hypothetical protein
MPPFIANRRQEIHNYIILPVVEHAVSFDLLVFVVDVFDVHPRVVRVVAEGHF